MATTTREEATCLNETQLKAQLQELLDGDLPNERVRQLAEVLLHCESLPQFIRESTPGNQDRFLDTVDRVCRSGCPRIVLPSRPLVRKGVPSSRSGKCRILDRTWGYL
jgi:hypothetical protein